MTVSILIAVSTLSAGGAERVVCELANIWASKGRRVGVLTLSSTGSDHYSLGPDVVRIPLDLMWESRNLWAAIGSNVRRSRALRQAIRSFAPDLVISFIEQTNVRVLAALVGCDIPTIVSERIDPRQYHVGRIWDIARRVVYPRAAAVIVQTRSVAEWAGTVVAHGKVRVIPNFVRPLRPPERRGKDSLILAVGRLHRQKGFDLLLRAYALSGAKARGYRLVILGEGPERKSLAALAQQLDIDGCVEMPGVVNAPEDWMERATIFVLSSRYEGFPNVLVEAMAMGCPVIAADCASGPREIVRHEHDGLLAPTEDVAALSAAMIRLFEDAALRERIGQNAAVVRERFSVPSVLALWDEVIEEVIAR